MQAQAAGSSVPDPSPPPPPEEVVQGELAGLADLRSVRAEPYGPLQDRHRTLRPYGSQGLAALVPDHDVVVRIGQGRLEGGTAPLVSELPHDVGELVPEEGAVAGIGEPLGKEADRPSGNGSAFAFAFAFAFVFAFAFAAVPDGVVVVLAEEVRRPHPHPDGGLGIPHGLLQGPERGGLPHYLEEEDERKI